MILNVQEAKDILAVVAIEVSGKLITDYSGRFMFGAECLGIICDNPTECIEKACSRGLIGARKDNMGLKWIVYWPGYKTN